MATNFRAYSARAYRRTGKEEKERPNPIASARIFDVGAFRISFGTMTSRIIILDTNAIFTANERILFDPLLKRSFNEARYICQHRIFIPRIALAELLIQKRKTLNKALDTHAAACHQILALSHGKAEPLTNKRQRLKRDLSRKIIDWVQTSEISLARIPFANIRWHSIVRSAVDRTPPFTDGKSEKGFRDALILETILHLKRQNLQFETIVITNDGLFAETLEKMMIKHFSDVDAYMSNLRAERDHISAGRLSVLLDQANFEFFSAENPKSIFFTFSLGWRVKNEFPDAFNPDLARPEGSVSKELAILHSGDLEEAKRAYVEPASTTYHGKEPDGKEVWVSVFRLYWYFINADYFEPDCRYAVRASFRVTWSAYINDENEFERTSIESIEHLQSHFVRAYPEPEAKFQSALHSQLMQQPRSKGISLYE